MSGETERRDLSYPPIGSMNIPGGMPAIFLKPGNPKRILKTNIWPEARRNFITGLVVILTALLFPFIIAGQTQSRTVASGQYVLDLPSTQWQAITVQGADYPRDFRFSDDNGIVNLRIRREIVRDESVSTTDVVERQRRLDRSARRGYVTGTVESFTGVFSGAKYSYEYVSAGKARATVLYYLRVTKRAIYRIEFTGLPKMLLDLADQTDSIARSFRLK
jgi:hypothetical protein